MLQQGTRKTWALQRRWNRRGSSSGRHWCCTWNRRISSDLARCPWWTWRTPNRWSRTFSVRHTCLDVLPQGGWLQQNRPRQWQESYWEKNSTGWITVGIHFWGTQLGYIETSVSLCFTIPQKDYRCAISTFMFLLIMYQFLSVSLLHHQPTWKTPQLWPIAWWGKTLCGRPPSQRPRCWRLARSRPCACSPGSWKWTWQSEAKFRQHSREPTCDRRHPASHENWGWR